MSSSDIITYSYPESPYAFKMHSIISLCGIKNYRNVPVSRVLPRPALAAIGVNYRRIPVMAVGKDVRDGSGQAHSTVKMPVLKEANTSIRLLILYGVLVVNI